MSRPVSTKGPQRGFSLLEVLVAFAVFSLALGVLFQIFSSGLRSADLARAYSEAVIIAESRLAVFSGDAPIEAGSEQGVVADKYHWSTSITPYDPEIDGGVPEGLEAFQVSVRVSWGEGNEREVALDTMQFQWVDQ